MTLNAIADAVRQLGPRLATEFRVAALYVFGSVARGEERDDATLRVDLVTRAALRPELKARIEAEASRVA